MEAIKAARTISRPVTNLSNMSLGNQQNVNANLCWAMSVWWAECLPISRNVWQLKGDSCPAAVYAIQHVRVLEAALAATYGI